MISIVQFTKLEDLLADLPNGCRVYESLVDIELSLMSYGVSRRGLVSYIRFHVPGSRIGAFAVLHGRYDRVGDEKFGVDLESAWVDAKTNHSDMLTWLRMAELDVRSGIVGIGEEKLIFGERWLLVPSPEGGDAKGLL